MRFLLTESTHSHPRPHTIRTRNHHKMHWIALEKLPKKVAQALHMANAHFEGDLPDTVEVLRSGHKFLKVRVPFGPDKKMETFLFDGSNYHTYPEDQHAYLMADEVLVTANHEQKVVCVENADLDGMNHTFSGMLHTCTQTPTYDRYLLIMQSDQQLRDGLCTIYGLGSSGSHLELVNTHEPFILCGDFMLCSIGGSMISYDLSKNAKPVDQCEGDRFLYLTLDGSIITTSKRDPAMMCTPLGDRFTDDKVAISASNIVTVRKEMSQPSRKRQRAALSALNAEKMAISLERAAAEQRDKAQALREEAFDVQEAVAKKVRRS